MNSQPPAQPASTAPLEGTYGNFPFGEPASSSGNDLAPTHFAQLDANVNQTSGLSHAMFRDYQATSGRWLSPDPYSGSYQWNSPQTFNRYVYASNRPLNLVDPLGLEVQIGDCFFNQTQSSGSVLENTSGEPIGPGAGPSGTGLAGGPTFCAGAVGSDPSAIPLAYLGNPHGGSSLRAAVAPNSVPTISNAVCTGAAVAAGASAGALIGESVGGFLGGLVGAGGGTLVAPGVGTVGGGIAGGSAGAGIGAGVGGFLGGLAGGAASNILCSKGGGSSFGGNQRENKQANDAKNEAERMTGKKFTRAQERVFHDEITGQNYGYHELVQIAVQVLQGVV